MGFSKYFHCIIPGWWLGTCFIFLYIGNVINPTDFHIFQRGRYTTNQILFESFGVKIKEQHRTVMDCAKA